MVTVQGLVFDAYGTLFDVHSVLAACQEFVPQAPALSATWRSKQLEYTWLRALMGQYADFWSITEAALHFALRQHAIRLEAHQQRHLLDAYNKLDTYPEVPAALECLRRYPLAILSNGTPHMLQAVLEHNQLQHLFRHVLSVDGLRTFKPNPLVYALAPQHLQLPAAAIGFVSSNAFDVIGAKAFGFQVAWINRANAPLDELGWLPDVVIQGLDQLPQALHL
jgi:2-haloacid dehalogenase